MQKLKNWPVEKETFRQKVKDLFRKNKKVEEKTEVKPAEAETKPKETSKPENKEETK